MNKKSIFRVESVSGSGTAFLIHKNYVLTCYHCVKGIQINNVVKLYDIESKEYSAKLCSENHVSTEKDIVLLELINDEIDQPESIKISPISISEENKVKLNSFGFPDHASFKEEGTDLYVETRQKFKSNNYNFDLGLAVIESPIELSKSFEGFSGSPLFYNDCCVAILSYQHTSVMLGAITVNSIKSFLEKAINFSVYSFPAKKQEIKYLDFLKEKSRIGFDETENLEFQETFGSWKSNKSINLYSKTEPVVSLIDEYFNEHIKEDNFKGKAVFIISDFGKGKSSFMRHYSAELASKYITDFAFDSYFPVYFNLKEFNDLYDHSLDYGVIYKYLENKFDLDLNDDYFKNRKFFFLIDSLDESGELTETQIKKVLENVFRIEKVKYYNKRNKIVIATRPIESFIFQLLERYYPPRFEAYIKNEKKEVSSYIALQGFTPEQFNNYLTKALKDYWDKPNNINSINNLSSFSKSLYNELQDNKRIELYYKLKHFDNEELQRPIFAYILYVLLSRNIDILKLGKVELYLEFLSQITKDAKHKNDESFEAKIIDELKFRNILHLTAALWQFKRNKSGQVTKNGIYNLLELGKEDRKTSDEVPKIEELEEIQFISHSYLGTQEDMIFFQHQSFAEVLLAEYYLKTFIKFLYDENEQEFNRNIAIGNPTEQTIEFLKGLIFKLKTSLTDINARKLLFPLFASMCVKSEDSQNKKKLLHSFYVEKLYLNWFSKFESDIIDSKEIDIEILNSYWFVSKDFFEKLNNLLKSIIERTDYLYFSSRTDMNIVDFCNERTILIAKEPVFDLVPDIDKWLALLIGNELQNSKLFTQKLDGKMLFMMLKNWNQYERKAAPSWGKSYFSYLQYYNNTTDDEKLDMSYLIFDGINFSHSRMENINFERSSFIDTDFSNSTFSKICFYESSLVETNFTGVNILKEPNSYSYDFFLQGSLIMPGVFFPQRLAEKLADIKSLINFLHKGDIERNYNSPSQKSKLNDTMGQRTFDNIKDIFGFMIKSNIADVKFIKQSFAVKMNRQPFSDESLAELYSFQNNNYEKSFQNTGNTSPNKA